MCNCANIIQPNCGVRACGVLHLSDRQFILGLIVQARVSHPVAGDYTATRRFDWLPNRSAGERYAGRQFLSHCHEGRTSLRLRS